LKEKYPDFVVTSYQEQFDAVFQPKLYEIIEQIHKQGLDLYNSKTNDLQQLQSLIPKLDIKADELNHYYPYYIRDNKCEKYVDDFAKWKLDINDEIAKIIKAEETLLAARELFCNIACGYGITLTHDVPKTFVDNVNEDTVNILMMFSEFQPILFGLSIKDIKTHLMYMFNYYTEYCYKNKEDVFSKYKSYVQDFFVNTEILKSRDKFFDLGRQALNKFPQHHKKAYAYYAKRHFPVQEGVLNVPSNFPTYNYSTEKIEAALVVMNKIIDITANGAKTYYFKPLAEYSIYSSSSDYSNLISTATRKSTAITDTELDKIINSIVETNVNPTKEYCDKLLIQAEDSSIPKRFKTVLSANTTELKTFIKNFIKTTDVYNTFSNPALFNAIDYMTYQDEEGSTAAPKLVKVLYDEMITKAMNYSVVIPFETLSFTTYTINTFDSNNGCPANSLNDFIYAF
jgi:hypothetical protein